MLYPRTGRQGEAHHKIASSLLPPTRRPNWIGPQDKSALRRKLVEELSGDGVALLSSEIFFGIDVDAVAEFFRDFDVSVVVLLRRQDLWLDSLLQHQLKVLEVSGDTDTWLEDRLASSSINYDLKISGWERVFGHDRVKVETFEQETMRQGLMQMFWALCEVDAPPEFADLAVNEKVSRDATAVLQALHHVAGLEKPVVLSLRRHLEDFSRQNPDPPEWKHIFSPQSRQRILDICAESNARLRARFFGESRSTLFFDNSVASGFARYPGLNPDRVGAIVEHLALNGVAKDLLQQVTQCSTK